MKIDISVKEPVNAPIVPDGFRLLADEEILSVSELSGYLQSYPDILNKAWRHDSEFGWKQGPYRYFWHHQWYMVPK